jgi:predicted P-loop ATPase
MSDRDDALEEAARFVEGLDFREMQGIWAKRKRDRENADLRGKTIRETRERIAEELRGLKTHRRHDAKAMLAGIAAQIERGQTPTQVDAWPLAWKGWVNIYAITRCNTNVYPGETTYRIELTDKGRAVLAETTP